jgi:hypothetical protein
MSRLKQVSMCHPDRPNYAKGSCKQCYTTTPEYKERQRQRSKEHYLKNKERIKDRCKEWNKNNVERRNKVNRQWYLTHPEKALIRAAKQRAIKYKLAFDIKDSDITIPKECPVLRIPLLPFSGKFHPNSPSIDRIDNSRGYTKDNTVVVSFRANFIKNNASVDELEKIYKFYASLQSYDGNSNPR